MQRVGILLAPEHDFLSAMEPPIQPAHWKSSGGGVDTAEQKWRVNIINRENDYSLTDSVRRQSKQTETHNILDRAYLCGEDKPSFPDVRPTGTRTGTGGTNLRPTEGRPEPSAVGVTPEKTNDERARAARRRRALRHVQWHPHLGDGADARELY